ncbi:hypothetical protein B0T25DRAFT_293278 [Lasiosphaeria hispida]|uniref:Protein kinase domain-containing protein n=1 Tax=Lasiosphaeria hispida TaxID=260671 RepID=A0AAJ0HCX9_9PEZI|nr:hypothetical protein B0T25DRAFT_293278 [Lasiosphaeria hispida]
MDCDTVDGCTERGRQRANIDTQPFSSIMLNDDPRLLSQTDLDETLQLRNSCIKQEADFLELAGQDSALLLVSRIGRVDPDSMLFQQNSAIVERGVPLRVSDVPDEERRSISLQVADLVARLHSKGIVHGSIDPSVLQWNTTGQLVFSDFSNARLADRGRHVSREQHWDGNEHFMSPRLKAHTRPGRCFFPTETDDLYSTAVTIWCIWAGKCPDPGMFSENGGPTPDLSVITDPDILGDVVDTLQQGGLHLDSLVSRHESLSRQLSPSPPASKRGSHLYDTVVPARSISSPGYRTKPASPDSRISVNHGPSSSLLLSILSRSTSLRGCRAASVPPSSCNDNTTCSASAYVPARSSSSQGYNTISVSPDPRPRISDGTVCLSLPKIATVDPRQANGPSCPAHSDITIGLPPAEAPVEAPDAPENCIAPDTSLADSTGLLQVPPPAALARRRNSSPLIIDVDRFRVNAGVSASSKGELQKAPKVWLARGASVTELGRQSSACQDGVVELPVASDLDSNSDDSQMSDGDSQSSSNGDEGIDRDVEVDADGEGDGDDELDEEITWEFPFPYLQGLSSSPTDSVVCLASPRGAKLPESWVRVTPEKPRIKHPRVQSINVTMDREKVDALDRLHSAGRRWTAFDMARTSRTTSEADGRGNSIKHTWCDED